MGPASTASAGPPFLESRLGRLGFCKAITQSAAPAAVLLIFLTGCSSRGNLPKTVPVSGKVTYKQQPVAGATVTFLGEGDTRPATAITTDSGGYQLQTQDAKGAMPGNYLVLVTKTELQPEFNKPVSMEEAAKTANQPVPPPKHLVPAKYGDATKTPLRFEVKDGQSNTFDLNLTD